jgi:hypothetical protein
MTGTAPDRLYGFLPAVLRIRDHDQGQPLRALLQIIQNELDRVDDDIAQLYDNWFIETCDEWVVPYIGDLLRVHHIHPVEAAGITTRAYVANTIGYRQGKGTAFVLEQLARDTTGWPAKAVEFFARLVTTQHMNHVRIAPTATPAIRDAEAAELTGSAFDPFGHTLEVRRIASRRGRYNIPNLGIFLWRLVSYPIGRPNEQRTPTDFATAREMAADLSSPGAVYYTFNPLGLDAPLFNDPQVEEAMTHLAQEENVPGPLRRLALHEELEAIRRAAESSPPGDAGALRFMAPSAPAFRVFVQWTPGEPAREVPRERVYLCEIPDEIELASPLVDTVAVDPERGRVALPGGASAHRVLTTHSYGFPGDIGGGPYERTDAIDAVFENPDWQRGVSHLQPAVAGQVLASLREAVEEWNLLDAGQTGVIALMDSMTDEDALAPLLVRMKARSRLLVVAADWPAPRTPGLFEAADVRPHHIGDLLVLGEPGLGERGRLVINGLLLEGSLVVADGDLGTLELWHSAIAPERGALVVESGNADLRLSLRRCVTGHVQLFSPIAQLSIADCHVVRAPVGSPDTVIDAPDTDVAIDQTTVLGGTNVRGLDASNAIFDAPVIARRRQKGCVRFSYVAPGSRTPRRYRCQPETAIAARVAEARAAAGAGTTLSAGELDAIAEVVRRRVVTAFESRQYGDPDFGQLALECPDEIRRGADSGSEMGAYCFLQQPQREANLRAALDEYLRFGLEAGVFFVTLPRRKERP